MEDRTIPLVVDLDGTLVTTDTLFENAMALIRGNPWLAARILVWAFRGKPVLKSEIARRVTVDVGHLPWRLELIEYLRAEKSAGRQLVLATAAHRSTAEAVAAHLELFDEVLSSDSLVNLKGVAKRDALVRRFGERGFDYIGDSRSDVPIWAVSRIAHLAGSARTLPGSVMERGAQRGKVFSSPPANLRVWLRSLRAHQWVKNVLVFAPAVLSHRFIVETLPPLMLAFVGFSLIASATYATNDLFDLDADRRHSGKRSRPLASGELSIGHGVILAVLLTAAGFGVGIMTSGALSVCLAAYMCVALAYSAFLKNKPVIDVVTLALLYTLRIFAGGAVGRVRISNWLFQFSIFFFLSLAFVKRYSELRRLRKTKHRKAPGRGYRPRDLGIISQAGVGSGLLAGLVLALYVNGEDVQRLYPRPYMLWGVCPLFLYWMTRVWLIAHRGNMHEDPILYAFRDRVSYIVGGLILVLAILGALPNAH